MSDIRCIRCGADTEASLYCPACFNLEFLRSVHEVVAREVDDRPEWVRRAQSPEPGHTLPVKELSR